MKSSTKPQSLKSVALMLLEDGAPIDPVDPQPTPMEIQNNSLDMNVDNYLMKYEKESLPTQQSYSVPGTNLMEFRSVAKRLLEAEGDDLAGDPAGDSAAGGEPPAEGGDPAAAPPGPPPVENPRFNVGNFAQSVARLVLNYEGLLDPRTTIMNRARGYLEKNYDAGIAKQMMEILEGQFQLTPRTADQTKVPTPIAGGAWGGVGGGGG